MLSALINQSSHTRDTDSDPMCEISKQIIAVSDWNQFALLYTHYILHDRDKLFRS